MRTYEECQEKMKEYPDKGVSHAVITQAIRSLSDLCGKKFPPVFKSFEEYEKYRLKILDEGILYAKSFASSSLNPTRFDNISKELEKLKEWWLA